MRRAQLGHVVEVHAIPAADHHGGQRDGGERGEELDALVGLEGGLVEVNVERHHQPLVIAGGGGVEAGEVVAQVAEIGQHHGPDELAVAAREPVDDVALRPDDGAQLGEIAAHVEDLGDEGLRGGVLGEDVLLEFLQFLPEFVDDRRVVVDEQVEQGVGEPVGAAGEEAGALRDAVDGAADRAQRRGGGT